MTLNETEPEETDTGDELAAMGQVVAILLPLSDEARGRALRWVIDRLKSRVPF